MTARSRSIVLAVFALLALLPSAAAAQPRLHVGDEVFVSSGPDGKQLIEPHLAAHPTDPNSLLMVGWAYPEGADRRQVRAEHCVLFRSSDGGRTWTEHALPSLGCADPWLTLTADRAVLTLLGTHPALPDTAGIGQLIAFFSPDAGRTWIEYPQSLGRGHDGPRTIGRADGTVFFLSGQGWRYGTGTLRFSVFVGRAHPGVPHAYTLTHLFPSNLNLLADGLAVLSDGTLVITWSDFQRPAEGGFRSRAGALERRRTWAVRSDDAGETFSLPLLVTEGCFARPTFLAADTSSGPYRDRLYHVCVGDGLRSILLAYSADGGEEWTAATPVEPPSVRDRSRREPQVAVNRHGIVAVAWMDGRDDPSGRCYAPYLAASADGGETFSPAVRVADRLSCPDSALAGIASRRWPTGGDYFGLAADASGRFHVVWPDARNGSFDLRATSVTVGTSSEP